MKRGERERKLEDRLHGRMAVRIEIAIESRSRQQTGDRDFSTRIGSNGGDLRLETGLCRYRTGEQCEEQNQAHRWSIAGRVLGAKSLAGSVVGQFPISGLNQGQLTKCRIPWNTQRVSCVSNGGGFSCDARNHALLGNLMESVKRRRPMRKRAKRGKPSRTKSRLGLPDLEHAKSAALVSLRSPESQRTCHVSWRDRAALPPFWRVPV